MAIDIKGIIEAKFKRDAKELNNTFLVTAIPVDKLSSYDSVTRSIIYSSGEQPIIFHYRNDNEWYVISDKRIIEKKEHEILYLDIGNISSVNSLLIYQKDFIEEKKKGLDYILLLLKSGITHKLNVEKKSFSVIDGVISYLVDKNSI